MGVLSTIAGFLGFGFGIPLGLVIGYYLFIYFQPLDVQVSFFLPLSFSLYKWFSFLLFFNILLLLLLLLYVKYEL